MHFIFVLLLTEQMGMRQSEDNYFITEWAEARYNHRKKNPLISKLKQDSLNVNVSLPLRSELLNIFIGCREYENNKEKLKTQTKCTLILSGLLIIEILPIPLTSLVCLYVIRKRPKWLPGVVDRLYAEKEIKLDTTSLLFDETKSIVTRRRCTISLSMMILLDFLIPFTILVGLYITRRRPIWFKNVVSRLYADLNLRNEKTDSLLAETN